MRAIIKNILRKILPEKVFDSFRKSVKTYLVKKELKSAYQYEMKRYLKNSASLNEDSLDKLMGNIIKRYHVIEKGLTMPETRLGFGRDVIISLTQYCILFIKKYGENESQLQHACQVILEYKQFHDEHGYELSSEIVKAIDSLKMNLSKNLYPSSQIEVTIDNYFSLLEAPFAQFSDSRHSVRNYSNKEISIDQLQSVLNLTRNTPSACNMQPWRTYIYSDKNEMSQILNVQGGNRGFGHLTNKLIIITADVSLFSGSAERYQAYIDGGMYAMNLLYSLHYHSIAACILNCSLTKARDIQLRTLCEIKDSEVFISMIVCGIPPQKFKIAKSERYNIEKTNRIK